MNKIIQSLWIGDALSNSEILCLKSYLANGHDFHLYVYEDIPNIPPGVILRDANELISKNRIFKDSHRTYASFADWFRIKLLFSKGGWWVDMDTICLQYFHFPESYCIASERDYTMEFNTVNNGYMKFPQNDPFLEELLKIMETKIAEAETIIWGELGVYLFRKLLKDNNKLSKYAVEPEVFCPIDFFDISSLICETDIKMGSETFAIHLWNEIWRRGCLSKNAVYHPKSIYEKLKERYL
ncbi:glycosyltransferase [Olivibacter sp. CPCC 100613]|uniref:glycosyltransferase n=1 Tax=Olivibacter sp. CPCC 100613 TaxID=3079931 RepID=UPI002FF595E1